ncbi:MAG: FAD-dependent oxidoreductase [Pseudomonadota bacterium]
MTRLVLLGGGHAHVLVLLSLANFISKQLEVKLVTPGPLHTYSGMVPGVVAGHYAVAEAQIDLAPLAARAGVELVLGSVSSIDPAAKNVALENGQVIPYDIASLNLGSLPDFSGVAGALEYAIAAKPFEPFLKRWSELLLKGPEAPRIAIAGAGAGGVEIAMAMKFALERRGMAGEVVLFSDRNVFSPEVAEKIAGALRRRGVQLRTATPILAVNAGPVVVSSSGSESFDALFWTAGAAAPPLLRASGIACDSRGFVRVEQTLRSVSHPEIFAAGDNAAFDGGDLPKSGVYAVRQGATLAKNLRKAILGNPLDQYQPQSKALALISCGEKYVIASRGSWSAEGSWAWWWKDWIDRRWIGKFT